MTNQNIIQNDLILVSDLLTENDKKIIKNNLNIVYVLPLENMEGRFQGYFRLDAKIESNLKTMKSDSLRSQLMPIVTGG